MSNPLEAYFTRMIAIFGSVDALAEDFVITKDTATKIIGMPEGPGKESAILGALRVLPEMKKRVTTDELKTKIDQAISKLTPVEENPSGGKRKTRKTRKQSKGASSWVQGVMRVFKEMKSKNPATKFRDALKEASKRKKAGNL